MLWAISVSVDVESTFSGYRHWVEDLGVVRVIEPFVLAFGAEWDTLRV